MVGTDIQSLDELRRKPALYGNRAVFTAYEREYCLRKRDPWESFGGLLCAKEACIKLFSAFLDVPKHTFVDLEIRHAENGRPILVPGPALAAWMTSLGLTIAVSISHSGAYASATAFGSIRVAA